MKNDKAMNILDQICRINRKAIYQPMTRAMERELSKLWAAWHVAVCA